MVRTSKRVTGRRSSAPSSSSSSLFLNPAYKGIHNKFFAGKNVISERFIDYESFPKYPILKCFNGEKLVSNFLHVQGPAPLDPVRLFYSQIHSYSEQEQSFQTFIQGKIHKITPGVIADFLGLVRPNKPVPYPPTSENELIVSKDKFRKAVYLNEYRDSPCDPRRPSCVKMKHLKPIISVLVRICQLNILPKASNYHNTNLESVYLSFLLLHGYPVDLSYVIWHTMALNGRPNAQTGYLPYGIIVGRLLSYLGHPVMANTRCADIPDPLDMEMLARYHLPSDPNCVGEGPDTETHSTGTCHPPTSSSRDVDDRQMLPFCAATPRGSSAEFDQHSLFESMQSIQHTMGIILFRFEQQSEVINRIARQQDRLAQRQDRYHALLMKYMQRAYPDQVKPVCRKCGDSGYAELLVYCHLCRISAEHRYCLNKILKEGDNEAIWICDECEETAGLESQQSVLATSPAKANEEKSTSGKKRKSFIAEGLIQMKGKDSGLPVELFTLLWNLNEAFFSGDEGYCLPCKIGCLGLAVLLLLTISLGIMVCV
ncbi:hypothetical protein MKW94_007628 [Papaver nudicaule]|uniref:PHD-type domain-containing protein n=1 Tax=Papaver nudicaule TaxID=74823 RepID=A0AA41UZU9_PAPNU|nr:hypothetical protein [Papaver nudicaule]